MMDQYILMLESDPDDREISAGYFNAHNIPVEFADHSYELERSLEEKYISGQKFPALTILNINSRPDNGLTVLQKIKSSERFCHIPVIILGEFIPPDLLTACYKAGANTVINKPSTAQHTDQKISSFIEYWFKVAALENTVS